MFCLLDIRNYKKTENFGLESQKAVVLGKLLYGRDFRNQENNSTSCVELIWGKNSNCYRVDRGIWNNNVDHDKNPTNNDTIFTYFSATDRKLHNNCFSKWKMINEKDSLNGGASRWWNNS